MKRFQYTIGVYNTIAKIPCLLIGSESFPLYLKNQGLGEVARTKSGDYSERGSILIGSM